MYFAKSRTIIQHRRALTRWRMSVGALHPNVIDSSWCFLMCMAQGDDPFHNSQTREKFLHGVHDNGGKCTALGLLILFQKIPSSRTTPRCSRDMSHVLVLAARHDSFGVPGRHFHGVDLSSVFGLELFRICLRSETPRQMKRPVLGC